MEKLEKFFQKTGDFFTGMIHVCLEDGTEGMDLIMEQKPAYRAGRNTVKYVALAGIVGYIAYYAIKR